MLLTFLLLACTPPSERTLDASPESTATTCIIREDTRAHQCEVDTFEYDGHVCVRWLNDYGSDMECWAKTP